MSRYRKIDPRFWKDEKITFLNRDEKLIALYLFTSAQSNRVGVFSFSPAGAAEDLGIPLETFAKGFMEPFLKVVETLRLGWDDKARVLFLPTWWKYNCPENPNVLKACLQDLHEIPQTPLLIKFFENLRYLPETFHQTFREGLPKPSPKRMADQEQEQEQKQDKEESAKPVPTSLDLSGGKRRAGKRTRSAPTIPLELQPTVTRVITKINELAGTTYQPESKIVRAGLLARLTAGATEADCLSVVEDRWRDWSEKPEMRQYFNPETLFRESKFEKYRNLVRMGHSGNGAGTPAIRPRGTQEIPIP